MLAKLLMSYQNPGGGDYGITRTLGSSKRFYCWCGSGNTRFTTDRSIAEGVSGCAGSCDCI